MTNRRALGRGLNSLIPDNNKQESNRQVQNVNQANKQNNIPRENQVKKESVDPIEERLPTDQVKKIPLDKIKARSGQPRTNFDQAALDELAESIRQYGLLNPIVVTKKDDHYEILAGERRYRASKQLGKENIDVIVREYRKQDIEVLSLVENVQREDLKALEEASAYKKLADKFQMTQDEIAKTMGKSRSYIANTMRLLKLWDNEKAALNEGKISPSQARTLLSISDEESRNKALNDFISGQTNIRNVEQANQEKKKIVTSPENKTPSIDDILLEDLEEKFIENLGSKVNIKKSGKAYKITIDCYDIEDVESIYEKLTKAN